MNIKIWNLYKNSDRGQQALKLFDPEPDDLFKATSEIITRCAKEHGVNYDAEGICGMIDLLWANLEEYGIWEDELNRDSYANFIERLKIVLPYTDEEGNILFRSEKSSTIVSENDYRRKATWTIALSFLFYYQIGSIFKPILHIHNFNTFLRNSESLGIELPPIPHTNDYRQYCLYYYDLCFAIQKWQEHYELTDAETCACIYDYATMLHEEQPTSSLPQPTNVWLTGASGEDFVFLDSLGTNRGNNPSGIWACNERTHRGDIVVVYCLSPRSYIHSIWRASSQGIFNPFDYYHCRTQLQDGILIPPISFRELKNDHYFSNLPIVRKNLQGINGIELTAQDFTELIRFIKQKGGNTDNIPRLFNTSVIDFGKISLEKDVEEKILIPILSRLGYSHNDYIRQLRLKAGRGERIIPDFVFLPHGEKHFETAPMVIEAKLDMSHIADYHNAFAQVLSYARMLHSRIMAICDKERIVIYSVTNGVSNIDGSILYENHWALIFSSEIEGATLNKLIGKETLLN